MNMNICSLCAGFSMRQESMCPLACYCRRETDAKRFPEDINRFEEFIQWQVNCIQNALATGNIKPTDIVEIQLSMKKVDEKREA